MKAVILAAGKGVRMRPLTDKMPKVMVPLRGKPLLWHIIWRFQRAGVERLMVVVGYLGEQVEEFFGNGSRFGLRIEYVKQEEQLGTAHAALLTAEWVGNEPFMFGWGDIIAPPPDYSTMWRLFHEQSCDALVAVNYLDAEALSRGGAVVLEGDRVVKIVEKPPPGSVPTNWNQAGIFVLKPLIFDYLRQVPLSPRGEYEFTSAMQAMIEDGHKVLGYRISGYRIEVGNLEQLAEAEELLREEESSYV